RRHSSPRAARARVSLWLLTCAALRSRNHCYRHSQANGEPIRVVFVGSTPEGRLPVPPNRFAANLVRYAVVWRKQFGFGLFRSRKSQIQSISRELHAMRLLECDQRYFHRPTNLVLNLEG